MDSVRFVLQQQHWDALTDDECKMVLRKMRGATESFLQGRQVIDQMAADGIIEKQQFQAIVDREQLNRALVEVVEDKGKDALTSFMEALLGTKQSRLYDILLSELQRSAAAVFPCQTQPVRLPEAVTSSHDAAGSTVALPGRQQLPGSASEGLQLVLASNSHDAAGSTVALPGRQQLPGSASERLQLVLASKSALELHLTADDQQLVVCPVCERVMTDPVLLPCLHSCCRSCVGCGDAANSDRPLVPNYLEDISADVYSLESVPLHIADAERDWPAGSELRSSLRQPNSCPVCGESMPIGDGLSNRLVTMRVALLAERAAGIACRRCRERGYGDVESIVRCMNCCTFMCQSCSADHDSFLKNHTVISCEAYFAEFDEGWSAEKDEGALQRDVIRRIIRSPPVTCIVHGNSMDMYCCDCKMLICSEYWKRKCLPERHQGLEPLEVLAARTRAEIHALASGLCPLELQEGVGLPMLSSSAAADGDAAPSISIALRHADGAGGGETLLVALQQLQRSLVEPLKIGKRALLDTVENSYATARDQVHEYCASLELLARRAEARVGRAVAYCRQLIRMGDDACIAEQHGTVVACLHRLLGSSVSPTSDDGTDKSDVGDSSALAICKDYLIIERRQLTDDYIAVIAELIGQPKTATADRPLRLHSVLNMAADANALVKLKEDDFEKAKEKEADETAEAQTATDGDLQLVLSPKVDTSDDGADKLQESNSVLCEELVGTDPSVQQLRERFAAAEDLIDELRVQLQQVEEKAARLEVDLLASQATNRQLDQQLKKLSEEKSYVDFDLKMLRLELEKVTGVGQSCTEPNTLTGTSTTGRADPAMSIRPASVLQDANAANSAVNATGVSWPQPSAGGAVFHIGGGLHMQPPRSALALRGRGFFTTGLQQPIHHFLQSPGAPYAVAMQRHPASSRPVASIAVPVGYAPASQSDVEGDTRQYQSLPSTISVPGRSRQPSSSEASGQKVLAIDRSVYHQLQEFWCRSADGESDFGFALTLLRTERLNVKCFDVALTHDGILAIATGKGVHLCLCTPTMRRELLQVGDRDAYRCVASVPDETDAQLARSASCVSGAKFVAGNKSTKSLELLVLSGSWPAIRCDVAGVLLKDHLPWCVAVDRQGRTAAVSSGRFVRTVPLDGSGEHKVEIGYTVSALTYCCHALIVGSSEKKDGRYALEARDASNVDRQLWKVSLEEAVSGLQCCPDSRCYVLLARSRVLRIVSTANGAQHDEVTLGCQLSPTAVDANDRWLLFLLGDSMLAQFAMHDVQERAEKC